MSSRADRLWVLDSSPIILLGKAGYLSLFERLASRIIVPSGVAREIEAGPVDDPARGWLATCEPSLVEATGPIDAVVGGWDLGRGESEVLTWARRHPGYEAVVDDRAARTCGAALGIAVRGTLGVVLLAKREAVIVAAEPVMIQLREAGCRIAPDLFKAAIRMAGEE